MTYKIIDFHAHAFPDKIEQKAVAHLAEYYSLEITQSGLLVHLLESADLCNIEKLVVHTTATRPSQVEGANTWIASVSSDRVIGFGTLHPGYHDLQGELQRIMNLGLKGLKLHPEFQQFDIDDKGMFPVYEMLDSDFPILFHMGDETLNHSSPEKLAKVLDLFPHLTVIGAHLGGYARWDEMREHLLGKDLYFDTSSALWRLNPEEAVDIIRKHGIDKVLFGTDYPITSHKEEMARFLKLPLSAEEQDKILWKNAYNLLKLNSAD